MHYEEIVKSTCEDALQYVSPWTHVGRKSQKLLSPANNTIVIIMIRCTSVPARVRAAAQRLEQKQRRQSWRWWSGWQWCWWQGGWWRSWQGRRWWWRQGWRWLCLRWWRWWDEKLFLKGWRAPSSIVGGVKEGETSSCTWGKEHQGEVTITTCISFAGARHNHLINNTKNKIRSQNQQNHLIIINPILEVRPDLDRTKIDSKEIVIICNCAGKYRSSTSFQSDPSQREEERLNLLHRAQVYFFTCYNIGLPVITW